MTGWETSNSAYGAFSVEDDDNASIDLQTPRARQATTAAPMGRDAALAAVRVSGDALMHHGAFRSDRVVVLEAVRNHVDGLFHADPALREDREIVLAAVSSHGRAIRYTDTLRDDPEIALAAVKNDGDALMHCSAQRANKAVVLAAVASSGFAIQYARPEIQRDPAVVASACAQNPKVRKALAKFGIS